MPAVLDLIRELAVFEREPDAVVVTVPQLIKDGFGPNPVFLCWVAEVEDEVVAMALCYVRYSTWKGPRLYLEDIVVRESMRGFGIGTALFKEVLTFAQEGPYSGMVWQVLDWNTPAIDFYTRFGAHKREGWLDMYIETGYEHLNEHERF